MDTIHPGEHLAEELEELRISAAELARQLNAPTNRITKSSTAATQPPETQPSAYPTSSQPLPNSG